MVVEKTPKTWFERMFSIISNKVPDFFNKKFDRVSDYEVFTTKQGTADVYVKEQPEKRLVVTKQRIEQLKAEKDYLGFMIEYNQSEHEVIQAIPNGNLKGQAALNALYVTKGVIGKDRKSMEALEREVISAMLKIIHQFNFYGKKIFRVEQSLTEQLLLTDCSKVDDDFLQLPFDSICLHVPYNSILKIRNSLVEYIFISQNDYQHHSEFDVLCVCKNGALYNDAFRFSGGDIKAQIISQMEEKYGNSKQAKEENISLFSFIMSVILYLNSSDVDQTTITPFKSKINTDLYSKLLVCSLGRNILINKSFSGVFNEGEKSERLIHILKWTVRGHFRHQKCGAKLSEEKIIWIKPFLKGKERINEDISAKPTTYILK